MSPSLSRFKSKASHTTSDGKRFEQHLLSPRFLPEAAVRLVSSLSCEEKAILIYLLLIGRNSLPSSAVSFDVFDSPWKPWRSAYPKAGKGQEVSSSSLLSSALASIIADDLPMSSSLAPCKCKAGVICGCFICYACYWKRWTASPNRDIINDILDVVETIPLKGDRMKKKKKKKKTNADEDALEQSAKKSLASWNQITVSSEESVPNDEGPSDANANVPLDSGSQFLCDIQDVPIAIARKASTRCRKRLFRTMKQKQNFTTDPHRDALQHEVPSSFPEGEIHNHSQAIAMEMTSEAPSFTAFAFASPDFEGKNCERPHQYLRSTKRRTNQVLPLNYEDGSVSGSEQFQESVVGSGIVRSCMSPTAADAGLGSRGLLGRVFPDTLGRIASRLWDLVSVRSRSHSVDYH